MQFFIRRCAAILGAAALILICSCEKHHVGEMPEVQKEHVDLAAMPGQKATEDTEPPTSPTPPAKPTPAEFFPNRHR